MEVVKETVNDLYHGHVVVGVTRVKIVTMEFQGMLKGVLLRTPGSGDPLSNAAPVWIGGNGVTADSAVATGGMPLPPGESMFVPMEQIHKLYAVSTAVDQDLAWISM